MSNKQTVEEAMSQCAKERGLLVQTDGQYLRGYSHGFKDAAAWQKEQGIDWISLGTAFPDAITQYTDSWRSLEVLVTDGFGWDRCYYWFNENGVPEGWGTNISFIPTHFAYINLPKTTQP